MIIKNTAKLRKRARAHARADHIQQGTYGSAKKNGKLEYHGCAIGCLATPTAPAELRVWIDKHMDAQSLYDLEQSEQYEYESDSNELVGMLRREFGINECLARAAETVFEGLRTHGEAIEFIPKFAAALPEGVNITPRMVQGFWEREVNIGRWEEYPCLYDPGANGSGWTVEGPSGSKATLAGDKLLRWLRKLGREAA